MLILKIKNLRVNFHNIYLFESNTFIYQEYIKMIKSVS